MLRKKALQTLCVVIILAVAIIGCAAKKEIKVEPGPGLNLMYRMSEAQVLKYQMTNESVQDLEIMGQAILIETNKAYDFSIKSKGMKEGNHQLEFTIDSAAIQISSPQGITSADMSAVLEKSFDMTLSPLGEELDLAGAKALQYEMGVGGKQSIAPDFQTIFPDLPGKPVEIGDTWAGKDTLDIAEGDSRVQIDMDIVSTLDGFETIDGLECVRVVSQVTGAIEGQGKQEGLDLVTKGDFKGSDTWYFAQKDGILVKLVSNSTAEATVTGTGPQNITIPLTQEISTEITLVK